MVPQPLRDRFDDIAPSRGRVGAHRAENPRARPWTVFLWAAAATVVFVVVGVVGLMVSDGRIPLFPEAAPTIAPPQPSTEPVLDMSYSVLVLNGTPGEGLATQMKDQLVQQQWAEQLVIAGNASDREFETTTVYYAVPEALPAALGLAELVGGAAVEEDPGYPFEGTPANQLTLVLGLDRFGGAEPQ